MSDWTNAPATGLEQAIADFKSALPGWWFRVGECQVSCDASCGPTRESPDIALIEHDERFDQGFDADLPQPSTLAEALRTVMVGAIEAKAAIKDQGRVSDADTGTDALIRFLSGDRSMLKCAVCGAQAGTCDCWEKCPCGWSFRTGTACNNPAHNGQVKRARQ